MPIFIYVTDLFNKEVRLINTSNIISVEPYKTNNTDGSMIKFIDNKMLQVYQDITEIQYLIDSKAQENYAPILKELKSLRALKILVPK